jgi:2-phosphoglycerate kinase
MAKIYVTDGGGGNPVPFLRGILTRSLNDAGLPFDQAYRVASAIRDGLNGSASVTNDALRALTREYLREQFPPAILESYDVNRDPAGRLQVRSASGEVSPFSQTEHMRCLAACGLSEEQARGASAMILHTLTKKQRWEIGSADLRALTYTCLHAHFGAGAADRYRVWMEFSRSGRPLILLIGGTSGSGKSTIATALAHRLGILRTQSTDMLREVMRMMIPERLIPVLHRSSFEAWEALPATTKEADEPVAEGYMQQTGLLMVPCDAVVGRAIRERVSLILEGVHVHPGMADRLDDRSDAVIVSIMLGVLKPEDLRQRLYGRGREAPARGTKSDRTSFDRIWQLQGFLLSEADRTGTAILINDDLEKVKDLVLRTVVDALAGNASVVHDGG